MEASFMCSGSGTRGSGSTRLMSGVGSMKGVYFEPDNILERITQQSHCADLLHGTLHAIEALGSLNAKKEGLEALDSIAATVPDHNAQLQRGTEPRLGTAEGPSCMQTKRAEAFERSKPENGFNSLGVELIKIGGFIN